MTNNLIKTLITMGIELSSTTVSRYFFSDIIPVFMLHRLNTRNDFDSNNYQKHIRQCLSYIRKHNYHPLSLDDYADKITNHQPIPLKSVVFTIDDGFYDQYETGGSLFSEFDISLTCYVITDFLDGKLWPWDDQIRYILENTKKNSIHGALTDGTSFNINDVKQNTRQKTHQFQALIKNHSQIKLYDWIGDLYKLSDVEQPTSIPDEYRPMSWANAQAFIDQGHAIAPHTMTHRILTQLPLTIAEDEIVGSIRQVDKKLKNASQSFAYPTGRPVDFNEDIIELLKKHGITHAVDTRPRHANNQPNLYRIPRFHLPTNTFDFIQYLSFFEELKRRLRQ